MGMLNRRLDSSGCVCWSIAMLYGNHKNKPLQKKGIPHIKALPFIGSMGLVNNKEEVLPILIQDCYNALKGHAFGAVFLLRHPDILLRDPDLIKTIAVKDFEFFTDHRTLIGEETEPIWSKGLFSLKGQRWRDMRSTLSPAFTSSKMKTMFLLVSECSQQLVEFLDSCYQQLPENFCNIKKDGKDLVLEMKDLFTRYTNDVIATTAFGVGVDSLKQPTNQFYLMGQNATNFGGFRSLKWVGFLMIPRLMLFLRIAIMPRKVTKFFKNLVRDTVETREKEGIVRPDMLQLLMQAKKGTLQDESSKEYTKNNRKLDDTDIAAQATLFFLAGFETTSTLLCFVSHQLAVHPDVQTRLQQEIDETLQEGGGNITYDTLHSMKYLDMVVSETLRLYPPAAAVDRLCVRNYTLNSDPPLELVPGDNVFIPIFGLHRDPKYFPDPDRFDPERFSDANKHKINSLTYLPFGIGPRSCIGNRFALMETKLVLTQMLSRFSLKVVAKTPVPIKIIQQGFNMTVEGGFWLGLQRRKY